MTRETTVRELTTDAVDPSWPSSLRQASWSWGPEHIYDLVILPRTDSRLRERLRHCGPFIHSYEAFRSADRQRSCDGRLLRLAQAALPGPSRAPRSSRARQLRKQL